MWFVSDQVGFISFRWEQINGLKAPNFYRTADGGATWQRVDLPMGEVTTENGYAGMHVTALDFADSQTGTVTVEMYPSGQEDDLACAFATADGGQTWTAVDAGPL